MFYYNYFENGKSLISSLKYEKATIVLEIENYDTKEYYYLINGRLESRIIKKMNYSYNTMVPSISDIINQI